MENEIFFSRLFWEVFYIWASIKDFGTYRIAAAHCRAAKAIAGLCGGCLGSSESLMVDCHKYQILICWLKYSIYNSMYKLYKFQTTFINFFSYFLTWQAT